MGIAGGDAVAMVDFDHLAVAAGAAGPDHHTIGGGNDGMAVARLEVDAGMHRRRAQKRVEANTVPAGHVGIATDRLGKRNEI